MKLEQLQNSLHEFLTNEEKLSASAKKASDSLRWIFKLNRQDWTDEQKKLLTEAIRNYTVINQHRDLKFWETVIPADINEENISAIFLDIRDKLGNPEKNKKYKELLIACFWISEHFAELLNLAKSILKDDTTLFKSNLTQQWGVPFQFVPRQLLFANIWFKEFEGAALHFLNKLPDELELYKDSFIYIENDINELYYIQSDSGYEKVDIEPNVLKEKIDILQGKTKAGIKPQLREKDLQKILPYDQFLKLANPVKQAVRSILRKFQRLNENLNQIIKLLNIDYPVDDPYLIKFYKHEIKKASEVAVYKNLDSSFLVESEKSKTELVKQILESEGNDHIYIDSSSLDENPSDDEHFSDDENPESYLDKNSANNSGYISLNDPKNTIFANMDFYIAAHNKIAPEELIHEIAPEELIHEIAPEELIHEIAPEELIHEIAFEKPSQEVAATALSQERLAKKAIETLKTDIFKKNYTARGGFFAGLTIELTYKGEKKEMRPPARVKKMIETICHFQTQRAEGEMEGYKYTYHKLVGRVLQLATEAELNKPWFRRHADTEQFYKAIFTTLNIDVSASIETISNLIRLRAGHWGTIVRENPVTIQKLSSIFADTKKTDEQKLKLAIYTVSKAAANNNSFLTCRSTKTKNFYGSFIRNIVLKQEQPPLAPESNAQVSPR